MTIPEFIGAMVGIVVELLWRFQSSQLLLNRLSLSQGPAFPSVWGQLYNRYRIWVWAFCILLIAILIEQIPITFPQIPILYTLFASTMIVALLPIIFSGLIGDQLLPRVNEQKMLAVHLIVTATMLTTNTPELPNYMLWLLLIPTLILIFQAIWPRKIPLVAQAFLYLWYIVTLIMLALQNVNQGYFTQPELTAFEAFSAASMLLFLSLHMLIGLRFLAIIGSLIFPRNRSLLKLIMPRLISEEQMPRNQLVLFLIFAALILSLNQLIHLAPTLAVSNLLILAAVQYDANQSRLPATRNVHLT